MPARIPLSHDGQVPLHFTGDYTAITPRLSAGDTGLGDALRAVGDLAGDIGQTLRQKKEAPEKPKVDSFSATDVTGLLEGENAIHSGAESIKKIMEETPDPDQWQGKLDKVRKATQTRIAEISRGLGPQAQTSLQRTFDKYESQQMQSFNLRVQERKIQRAEEAVRARSQQAAANGDNRDFQATMRLGKMAGIPAERLQQMESEGAEQIRQALLTQTDERLATHYKKGDFAGGRILLNELHADKTLDDRQLDERLSEVDYQEARYGLQQEMLAEPKRFISQAFTGDSRFLKLRVEDQVKLLHEASAHTTRLGIEEVKAAVAAINKADFNQPGSPAPNRHLTPQELGAGELRHASPMLQDGVTHQALVKQRAASFDRPAAYQWTHLAASVYDPKKDPTGAQLEELETWIALGFDKPEQDKLYGVLRAQAEKPQPLLGEALKRVFRHGFGSDDWTAVSTREGRAPLLPDGTSYTPLLVAMPGTAAHRADEVAQNVEVVQQAFVEGKVKDHEGMVKLTEGLLKTPSAPPPPVFQQPTRRLDYVAEEGRQMLLAGGSWHIEDLPELYADPAFRAASPGQKQQTLGQVLALSFDDLTKRPGFDRKAYQAFNAIASKAREQVAAMKTWGDTADQFSGVVGDALTGTARTAIAASADLSAFNPDGSPRVPAGNILEQAGFWFQKAGDTTLRLFSWNAEAKINADLEALHRDLTEGNFPLKDGAEFQSWLVQRSQEINGSQLRWYKAVHGLEDAQPSIEGEVVPSDEAVLTEAYAMSNSLLHPRNAALMGEFIKTRNPEVWDQLTANLKKTPQRAQTEADQAQSLAESQIVNFLTQNMGGGDYAEHMIAAGDPIQMALMLVPYLKAGKLIGGAGRTASGVVKEVAKTAVTEMGINSLQTLVENPDAKLSDFEQMSLDYLMGTLGMAAINKGVSKVAQALPGNLPLPNEKHHQGGASANGAAGTPPEAGAGAQAAAAPAGVPKPETAPAQAAASAAPKPDEVPAAVTAGGNRVPEATWEGNGRVIAEPQATNVPQAIGVGSSGGASPPGFVAQQSGGQPANGSGASSMPPTQTAGSGSGSSSGGTANSAGGGAGTPLQVGGGTGQAASGGEGSGSSGANASGQPANNSPTQSKAPEDGSNPHSQDTANDTAPSAPVKRVRPPFVGDPRYGTPRPVTGSKPVEPALDRFSPEGRKLSDAEIEADYDEMWTYGHTIDRHGPDVTDGQLAERALNKIDPITMTEQDGVHPAKRHSASKHATQFTSRRAMAQAKRAVEMSAEYQTALANAVKNGDTSFPLDSVMLETALGPNYLDHVRGKSIVGSNKYPQGTADTNLTGGRLLAVFQLDSASGKFKLYTMYAIPQ